MLRTRAISLLRPAAACSSRALISQAAKFRSLPVSARNAPMPQSLVFLQPRGFATSSEADSAVKVIADLPDYEAACKDNQGKLIVAYHTAAWCGPCKRIWPHVEELAKSQPGVAFLKIDVDECGDVASHNSITAMPTFLFFKDGKIVENIVGANLEALLQGVAKHK